MQFMAVGANGESGSLAQELAVVVSLYENDYVIILHQNMVDVIA